MNLVDSKYIGLVSSRLQKFKKVKTDLYNFRCPICGDSQKNKSKTRGYLYSVKADMNYRCHNCGASMTLSNFLKEIDPNIHKQYVFSQKICIFLINTYFHKKIYFRKKNFFFRKKYLFSQKIIIFAKNIYFRKKNIFSQKKYFKIFFAKIIFFCENTYFFAKNPVKY